MTPEDLEKTEAELIEDDWFEEIDYPHGKHVDWYAPDETPLYYGLCC